MRNLLAIIVIIGFSSCSTVCTICDIDAEANKRISERFDNYDKTLWPRTEAEFFNRLFELDSMFQTVDKRLAVVGLSAFVSERGYPSEYYVDFDDPETKKLLTDLKAIGISEDKNAAHEFLYQQINPAVRKCDNLNDLLTVPRDMVVAYGATNPDSVLLSFEIGLSSLHQYYGVMELKRPALYKTLIILYFTRMMDEEKKPHTHNTH